MLNVYWLFLCLCTNSHSQGIQKGQGINGSYICHTTHASLFFITAFSMFSLDWVPVLWPCLLLFCFWVVFVFMASRVPSVHNAEHIFFLPRFEVGFNGARNVTYYSLDRQDSVIQGYHCLPQPVQAYCRRQADHTYVKTHTYVRTRHGSIRLSKWQ